MTPVPPSAPPQRPLIGVVLMVGAMSLLPFIDVMAKVLGQQGMSIVQVVWARLAFGALITLPFAVRIGGAAALVPDRPVMHLCRAGLLIAATWLFFAALLTLPIADALAIFFVQPLILTVLSPVVLGEKVGRPRQAAVLIGFVGTLIIIRPGLQQVNIGVVYALGAGASLACYLLLTRRIAGQANALVTTFQTSLMGTLALTAIVFFAWQPATAQQWLMFAALGAIAVIGHLMITYAYDHAEASLLAPLAYTEMIMATLLGWWFFGDLPDRWTILGVMILIASAIYISRHQTLRSNT